MIPMALSMSNRQVRIQEPAVRRLFEAIAKWVECYRYAISLRNELVQCGADEVAQIAHDLRMSPRELVTLASKGLHAAEQLPRMLLALGVDPAKLANDDPALMGDMRRSCITCGYKGRCEHEFAAGTAARHYQAFCPNALSLDALFADRRGLVCECHREEHRRLSPSCDR